MLDVQPVTWASAIFCTRQRENIRFMEAALLTSYKKFSHVLHIEISMFTCVACRLLDIFLEKRMLRYLCVFVIKLNFSLFVSISSEKNFKYWETKKIEPIHQNSKLKLWKFENHWNFFQLLKNISLMDFLFGAMPCMRHVRL